jgi:hypothetical protein
MSVQSRTLAILSLTYGLSSSSMHVHNTLFNSRQEVALGIKNYQEAIKKTAAKEYEAGVTTSNSSTSPTKPTTKPTETQPHNNMHNNMHNNTHIQKKNFKNFSTNTNNTPKNNLSKQWIRPT